MFAKLIHHHNFAGYGDTIRSGDNMQFLQGYDYEEITPDNANLLYQYSQPVYIEPAQGVGVLYVRKPEQEDVETFVFSRPVCIKPGVWFCAVSLACRFSYHLFYKGSFTAREFDALKYRVVYNQQIVCSNLYTVSYQERSKNFVFKGESHPFWELLYVDVGTILCTVEEKQYELTEGMLVLFAPDVFHALQSESKQVSFVNITFDLQNDENHTLCNQVFTANKAIHSYIQQIVVDFNDNNSYSGDYILNYLNLIILNLLNGDKKKEYNTIHSFFYNSEASLMVKKAEEIVDEEIFNSELSVSYVANQLNISASYLFRCFKQHHHMGTSEYICAKKLEIAKKMIVEGELTLAEIGMKLNFCSQTYFSTQFKKKYNMTPSQYSKSVFRK